MGIAIGILALTVVGALAERLHTIVARSNSINTQTILAFPPNDATYVETTSILHPLLNQLGTDRRIKAIYPEILLPYRIDFGRSKRFGPPALIAGLPDAARADTTQAIVVAHGRLLRPADRLAAFVGASIAQEQHLEVGSIIALYGNSYTVVGIGEMGFTIFDTVILIQFQDAKSLLNQIIPPSSASTPQKPISALSITTMPGVKTASVAHEVSLLTGFDAPDPAQRASVLSGTTQIFDSIIFGGAAVALLVASFSIVNTMMIAVSERTREIGIRKAIGAHDHDLFTDFLLEAAAIGAIGGLVGILFGGLLIAYFDARSVADGSIALFELSPRLGIGAFVLSILMSIVAGWIPALRAAQLDPVEALRKNV